MTEKRYGKFHKQMMAILGYECVLDNETNNYLTIREVIICLNEQYEIIQCLQKKIKELEIENQGQSDAIDGLHDMMAHYDLEDL